MSRVKLVRDKVPQIIRGAGGDPATRIAGTDEYRYLLRAKLIEEVGEFLASDDPQELADIVEVVLALAADLGVDRHRLEEVREAKAIARGGFADRIVWSGGEPAAGTGEPVT
jgi:predicted house-cleaning noncanonical NTP pyrophosphatase (MazG superfamily)